MPHSVFKVETLLSGWVSDLYSAEQFSQLDQGEVHGQEK